MRIIIVIIIWIICDAGADCDDDYIRKNDGDNKEAAHVI